jgi:hypothetical protein
MRILLVFISSLLSFHLFYSVRRVWNQLIQSIGGAQEERHFIKARKTGHYFYEKCSIVYKLSSYPRPSKNGRSHMVTQTYKDSMGWYRKCFSKITFSLDRGLADMVAYELFSFDEKSGYEFIGILPERRKDPKRITNQSVVNWGRMVLGDRSGGKKIFFNRVAMEDVTGRY